MVFAEKIRRLVERSSFAFEDKTIPITISVGVATVGEDPPSVEAFIKMADEKLYEAKDSGRNCIKG